MRAEAAWWLGRMDGCIASRGAASAILDECGEHRRTAQCAVWLYEHYCFQAQPNIGAAWLLRARRILDGDDVGAEYRAGRNVRG